MPSVVEPMIKIGAMITLKKLELVCVLATSVCGLATSVVAILLSAYTLKFDWDASLIVKKEFSVLWELFGVSLLFLIPGALVGVGSYA